MGLSVALDHIIRTFCFHRWEKWSKPFTGTWVLHHYEENSTSTEGYMTQRRTCLKCGRVSYRKCK